MYVNKTYIHPLDAFCFSFYQALEPQPVLIDLPGNRESLENNEHMNHSGSISIQRGWAFYGSLSNAP